MDALCSLYGLLLLCALSGMATRILYRAEVFFPSLIGAFLLYSLAFYYGGDAPALTISRRMSWAGLAIIVLALLIGIAVFSRFAVQMFYHSTEHGLVFVLSLIGLAVIHGFILAQRYPRLHIHHYYLAYVLALFCVVDSNLATVTQAICVAVHLHGRLAGRANEKRCDSLWF